MNAPRDTLVGDALRSLDVPDHDPQFWNRFEQLSAVPASQHEHEPDQGGGARVVELGAEGALRSDRPAWSRRGPAVAAAAVLVALALGVGVALTRASDGDARLGVADRTQDAPPVERTPPPETTTTPPDAPVPQPAPQGLATEWLTRLRSGEVDAAYALLDETSQAALSLDAFADEVAAGLAEGATPFADLPATTIPLLDDEGLAATAVVYTGDVQRDGSIETASYGVVVTGDPEDPTRAIGVSFGVDGPTVEAAPLTDPAQTRTSPLELEVSPTAGATWAIVDGGEPLRIDDGEASATIDVEGLAGPGTHTVVVVSTEAGRYTSRSFTVLVP